jgi:hypothetical protein
MPRIIVASAANSEGESAITLDEDVASSALGAEEHSDQLIERVGWAVHDADEAEGRQGAPDQRRRRRDQVAGRLAEVAHAVRDHEATTRRRVGTARPADDRLYRRLRQAFQR